MILRTILLVWKIHYKIHLSRIWQKWQIVCGKILALKFQTSPKIHSDLAVAQNMIYQQGGIFKILSLVFPHSSLRALFKVPTIADQFMVETICLIFQHEHFFLFWQLFYKIICHCFEIFSLILKCECWGLILKGVFQEYWQNMRRWPHLDVEEYQTSVFPPEQIE